MQLTLDTNLIDDYRRFLRIKSLPIYSFRGGVADFPDEYADLVGVAPTQPLIDQSYFPHPELFDYQSAIARIAIRKQKFAAFVRPGLGKTFVMSEFARHAVKQLGPGRPFLIFSPLNVIDQTLDEINRFYRGWLRVRKVSASHLQPWLDGGGAGDRIGITNYEAIKPETEAGKLGGLALDESSMLASHYGKWAQAILKIGRGLHWKLCLTGTPAPNDRIEFANHAVFLDQFPTINAFLARYFVNRGQTQNRWELKPHALQAFYRSLSHWCIFVSNPATYGWKDNCNTLPPISIIEHDVPLTPEQEKIAYGQTRTLFANEIGGITGRSMLGLIAKGFFRGEPIPTNKPTVVRELVNSWKANESTIIWCIYNDEQKLIASQFGVDEIANIAGDTPLHKRIDLIRDFKSGKRRILISKPKILGLGLNLQIATRQVFSGLQDSYLYFFQAICRSNRVGSTLPLSVHIPITEIERPMIETVMRKLKRIEGDTAEQEGIFKQSAILNRLN